jgi:hypothetical protein
MSDPSLPPPATNPSGDEPLVCRTTPYFARRMLSMAGIIGVFAAWFFYDGAVVYPKKYKMYQAWLSFKGKPADEWKTYAKDNSLDEDPSEYGKYDASKVQGQYLCGGIAGLIALIIAGRYLLKRNTTLTADGDSLTTPGGTRIPFDSVTRIDLRKWQPKGLGYLTYTDTAGATKKATLDDFYYDGAPAVLKRLRERCPAHTEIIDFEESETSDDSAAAESSPDENVSPKS